MPINNIEQGTGQHDSHHLGIGGRLSLEVGTLHLERIPLGESIATRGLRGKGIIELDYNNAGTPWPMTIVDGKTIKIGSPDSLGLAGIHNVFKANEGDLHIMAVPLAALHEIQEADDIFAKARKLHKGGEYNLDGPTLVIIKVKRGDKNDEDGAKIDSRLNGADIFRMLVDPKSGRAVLLATETVVDWEKVSSKGIRLHDLFSGADTVIFTPKPGINRVGQNIVRLPAHFGDSKDTTVEWRMAKNYEGVIKLQWDLKDISHGFDEFAIVHTAGVKKLTKVVPNKGSATLSVPIQEDKNQQITYYDYDGRQLMRIVVDKGRITKIESAERKGSEQKSWSGEQYVQSEEEKASIQHHENIEEGRLQIRMDVLMEKICEIHGIQVSGEERKLDMKYLTEYYRLVRAAYNKELAGSNSQANPDDGKIEEVPDSIFLDQYAQLFVDCIEGLAVRNVELDTVYVSEKLKVNYFSGEETWSIVPEPRVVMAEFFRKALALQQTYLVTTKHMQEDPKGTKSWKTPSLSVDIIDLVREYKKIGWANYTQRLAKDAQEIGTKMISNVDQRLS